MNPIETPDVYNVITLDKDITSPGLALIQNGGDREKDIQQVRSPGFTGWRTLDKGEIPTEITYRFTLWKVDHFAAWDVFIAILNAGSKKKRVYKLTDPCVTHNAINQVTYRKVSAMIKVSPGKYAYDVTFAEYRKGTPIVGVPVPEKTETDERIVSRKGKVAKLNATLEALQRGESPQVDIVDLMFGGDEP